MVLGMRRYDDRAFARRRVDWLRFSAIPALCVGLAAGPATPGRSRKPEPVEPERAEAEQDDELLRRARDKAGALEEQLRKAGALSASSAQQLGDLRDLLERIEQRLAASRERSARAWVKMACYTAWIVSRESGKKPASLRLIQITRATGGTGEVQRYQERHEMLLRNIQDAASRYGAILSELGRLPEEAVARGFDLHEQDLANGGMAEQIKVNHLVRKHWQRYGTENRADPERWVSELEEL
jgi:hypothetical protein